MKKTLLLLSVVLLSGCMAAQQMHFSQESAIDFSLPSTAKIFEKPSKYSLRTITDNGYQDYGQFSNYSWHGFYQFRYEGFKRLPYDDTNYSVRTWLSEIMVENGIETSDSPDYYIDVHIDKLKLKSQKDAWYDYRACMITLRLDFSSPNGNKKFSVVTDGISKLGGSGIKIVGSSYASISVLFYPDTPPICKLAIADALRKAKI